MAARILVVDDDPAIAATLSRVLAAEGHEVLVAGDGPSALASARASSPDLVVLDILLPGFDGVEVCRRLRAERSVPILLLTALDGVSSRVSGLDSGADDYLVKPFAYPELLARVRALLRRAPPPGRLSFLDVVVEPSSRRAWRTGTPVELTSTEFDLLSFFMRHPRQVLSRSQLVEAVWDGEVESDNVVAVYVGYLRLKLGAPLLLHTVRGAGYVLREA